MTFVVAVLLAGCAEEVADAFRGLDHGSSGGEGRALHRVTAECLRGKLFFRDILNIAVDGELDGVADEPLEPDRALREDDPPPRVAEPLRGLPVAAELVVELLLDAVLAELDDAPGEQHALIAVAAVAVTIVVVAVALTRVADAKLVVVEATTPSSAVVRAPGSPVSAAAENTPSAQ